MSFACVRCKDTFGFDMGCLVDSLPCSCMMCKDCADTIMNAQVERHVSVMLEELMTEWSSEPYIAQLQLEECRNQGDA